MSQMPFKPIYENDADAQNEANLAALCETKWHVKMVRQKKLAQFDYMACSGNTINAFVEMRCLNEHFDDHAGVIISATKLVAAKQMRLISSIPHLFVVQWVDDVIAYANLNKFMDGDVDLIRSPITNNRRNAPDDLEAVAYVPKEIFQIMV
jgi:hypothetical protein